MAAVSSLNMQDERTKLIFRLLLINKWFLIPTSVAYEWLLSNSPFRSAVYSFINSYINPTIFYIAFSLILIVILWMAHRRLAEGRTDYSYVRAIQFLSVLSFVLDVLYVFFLVFVREVGSVLWFVLLPAMSFPLLIPLLDRGSIWIVDGAASTAVLLSILGWFRSMDATIKPYQFIMGNVLLCQAGLFYTWVSLRAIHTWIQSLIREIHSLKNSISLWNEVLNRFPADFFLANDQGEILMVSDGTRKWFPLPPAGTAEWPEESQPIRNALLLRFHSETVMEEAITVPDDTRENPVKIYPSFIGHNGKRYCIALLQEEASAAGAPLKMLRSARLTIAGQIAAGLAHELGNPLGIIQSCAAYLRQKAGDQDPFREEFELIEKESRRCQNLIDRLLSLVSPKRDTPAFLDLREVLEHSVTLVKYQAGKRDIEFVLPAHPVSIFANEGQLSSVFVNLFLNAIQSMETSPPTAKLRIHARVRGTEAVIDITDEGVGIAPGDLEKIFDPFFTKRADGTGLGLSIVHQIITNLGGRIDVASRVNSGTTFTVILPIMEKVE